MDDPREILKAAGVEVPEVEEWWSGLGDHAQHFPDRDHDEDEQMIAGDAAVLALSRLVARYKWQRDQAACHEWGGYTGPGAFAERENLAFLDRLWEERSLK